MTNDTTRWSMSTRKAALLAFLLFSTAGRLFAQQAVVTPLMTKALGDLPGEEALMISVTYPPGSSDAIQLKKQGAPVLVPAQ